MEMHQLRYFVHLARIGNFTQAAEECCVSQPSLSQAIAKLERHLGCPLLERLPRGLRLTEAGRRFLLRAEQILRLADEAQRVVADQSEAGRLVIGAIPTVAPYFLPAVLGRFAQAHPRDRLEVIERPTEQLLELLALGELDLALLALPVSGENLCVEMLFSEELLVCLPDKHPLATHREIALETLAKEPFVLLHEAHCLTSTTRSFCARHDIAPLVTARIHQLATVQELVRLGQGVSLVPAMAATQDHHPQRVYRRVKGDQPKRTLAAVWNQLRYRSQVWDRWMEVLRAASREHI
ncbi:MAG: LysR family transcriptional regulator [Gemmataceae bacterium]